MSLGNSVINFYNPLVRKFTSVVLWLALIPACHQPEMQTYRVPKEPDTPAVSGDPKAGEEPVLPDNHPPLTREGTLPSDLPAGHPDVGGEMSMANASAQGIVPPAPPREEVTWTVPQGWLSKPGSGFRYATLVIPGSGSLSGDLSVTVLEGDAGGLLSNVNRWRGQIGLPDLSESQLLDATKKIRPGGRDMMFVTMVSESPLIDGKLKKRLTAAVLSTGGKTWFFKLTGEDQLVRSSERDFMKFLESLKGL